MTRRKRPSRVKRFDPPPGVDLDAVAVKTRYIGSPEHKDVPGYAGVPEYRRQRESLRPDASRCPETISVSEKQRDMVQGWLRNAIRAGHVSAMWENGFPRYVWHREDDTVFEGRHINGPVGTCKGYPLDREEWPVAWRGV